MVGHQFTWEKSRGSPSFVEEKLDRAFADSGWFGVFAYAYVLNEDAASFDHSAIGLYLGSPKTPYSTRFRFENAWLRDDACKQAVGSSWDKNRNKDISCQISAWGEDLQSWGRKQRHLFRKQI